MKKTIKIIYIALIIIIILTKLFLVSNLPINALYESKYDDALMVKLANNIIEGKWLGEYNRLTLVKGVVTPLFIAIAYFLHIPFLIAQELVYIGACILFIRVIKKKIPNKIALIIIFSVVIFSPITYSTNLTRIYRDGIYASFILYLISIMYAIFLNRKEPIKNLLKYFIGLGIIISLIFNTREETIWILPFILLASIITILMILFTKDISQKKQKILLYIIPIVILGLVNLTIATANYYYYKTFTLNQYWGKEFKEAYGALTRVTPEERIKRVPVTKETMRRIYEISPKFKELEEFFEGEKGKGWSKCGDESFGEIEGGWFHWALMKAVEERGYYENANKANAYYRELANEINTAVEEEKIDGLKNKRVSNTIITTKEDIPQIFEKLINVIRFQVDMDRIKTRATLNLDYNDLINMDVMQNELDEDMVNTIIEEQDAKNLFKKVTRGKLLKLESYETGTEKITLNICNFVENLYTVVNPYLAKISIITYAIILFIFLIKPKKYYEEFLILSGLLCIYSCRVIIIAYTAEQMYTEGLNAMYLSSIYAVQYLFGVLGIIFVTNIVFNIVNILLMKVINIKKLNKK